MAGNSRATGIAAFLAVGLLGGGVALPTVAAAEPAVARGHSCFATRLAEVRAIAGQYGDSVQFSAKPQPDPFSDVFVRSFGKNKEPC